MTSHRSIAVWTGALFILATVMSVAALLVSSPITEAADVPAALKAAPSGLVASVLLMYGSAFSIVMIPVVLYPVLRCHSPIGALTYFAVRFLEGLVYVLGGLLTLAMLWVARLDALADPAGQISVLKSLADVTFATGTALIFGMSAVVLGWLFWRSALVPAWLSIWKLIGGMMIMGQGIITLFGPIPSSLEMVLFMPIAVNEMVLAIWLIALGFDAQAADKLGLN